MHSTILLQTLNDMLSKLGTAKRRIFVEMVMSNKALTHIRSI